jgi:hypothetical protein
LGQKVYPAKRNARRPEINLTTEGIKLDGPDGATAFLPWHNFKGWREGRQVVDESSTPEYSDYRELTHHRISFLLDDQLH